MMIRRNRGWTTRCARVSSSTNRKGTAFETATVRYLQWALQDDRIMRPRLQGSGDIGDIANVRCRGARVTIQCKAAKRPEWTPWWRDALEQAGNYDAPYAVVLRKLKGRGLGLRSMNRQEVYMAPGMLDALLDGASFEQVKRVKDESYRPSKRLPFVAIPLRVFALILNDFIALGPDTEEE